MANMKKLNNSGFAVFSSMLGILTTLLVFSAILFTRTISENSAINHEIASLQAQYGAEAGIEYIYYELINASPDTTNWFTHTVNGQDLVRNDGSSFTIQLSSINESTSDGYASKSGSAVQFACKAYNDPSETVISGKIVLCRGVSGGERKLIAQKIGLGSLYEYFMFFPEQNFRYQGNELDATGGKIHTNKDFVLGWGKKYKNVSSLSAAGHIYTENGGLWPPFTDPAGTSGLQTTGAPNYLTKPVNCDDPSDTNLPTWVDIMNDPQGMNLNMPTNWKFGQCYSLSVRTDCWYDEAVNEPYKSYNNLKLLNGFTGGGYWSLICRKKDTGEKRDCYNLKPGNFPPGTYVPTDWEYIDPIDPANDNTYKYKNFGASSELESPAIIKPNGGSDVPIPSRMQTEYTWMPYRTACARETEKWYSGPYWWNYNNNGYKKYGYPQSMFDPNDRQNCDPRVCRQATFTDTKFQPNDWINFLDNAGSALKGIVKEASTGGTTITNPTINASNYRNTAINKGIYIRNTIAENEFNNTDHFEWFRGNYVNTWLTTPAKTLENGGNYEVQIGERIYTPDGNGEITIGGLPVFKKQGFYNYQNTFWSQMVLVDVGNLKTLIQNNSFPNLQMNLVYSDWGVGLKNAAELPTNGLTVTTEGDAYAIGDVNTVNYQPASIITKRVFYPLSENFNFPQTLPELTNDPDAGWGYPNITNQNFVTDTENRQWQQTKYNEGKLPNKVMKNHIYNVSVIGEVAPMWEVLNWGTTYLELYAYPQDGDWTNTNPVVASYNRAINGTFLILPQNSFVTRYNYGYIGWGMSRRCNDDHSTPAGWPSCRGNSSRCNAGNEWCKGGTGTIPMNIGPSGGSSTMQWEPQYATGPKPPGDLGGISIGGWLPLAYSADNFNKHVKALQSNP